MPTANPIAFGSMGFLTGPAGGAGSVRVARIGLDKADPDPSCRGGHEGMA